jgi:hypothetical protein
MSAGKFHGGRGVELTPKQSPPLRPQQGFVYIGLLLFTAVTGAALVAFSEIASHTMQREKEAELLFRGNQYREAIAAYHRIEDRYPQSLEQLLENKGFSMPVRHLRRLYADPITGEAFAVVRHPDGGIMGVHSTSVAAPIKTGNFSVSNQAFASAASYAEWTFVHSPLGLSHPIDKARAK